MDDDAGAGIGATDAGDLPERPAAGCEERASKPDRIDTAKPHFFGAPGTPAELIDRRSAELGLHTPAQHALESSLFIDEPLHQIALLSRQPRPELLFSEKGWAGYLDARAFARQYGDQELTVPFMTELHRRISHFSMPHRGGAFVSGRRIGINPGPLTDKQLAAVDANPYLEYLPPGTVPLGPLHSAVEYRTQPNAIGSELQAVSDWYNNARGLPGTDPYRLAAELQQRYVSIHPWDDYNGRSSRILMNWSLERHGLHPSAPSDFNEDIFSTTEDWTDMVRAGSATWGERANRLEHLGDTADPIEVFGLEREHRAYQAQDNQMSIFPPGANFDIEWYRTFLKGL
ncbi:Fic family protein [Nocardia sp. NPDC004750]